MASSLTSNRGKVEVFESPGDSATSSSTSASSSSPSSSLSSPPPPTVNGSVIHLDLSTPSAAFAHFSSKIYSSGALIPLSSSSSSSSSPSSSPSVPLSSLSTQSMRAGTERFESPVDKFNRLKSEVGGFIADIQSFLQSLSSSPSSSSSPAGLSELVSSMAEGLDRMNRELDHLMEDKGTGAVLAANSLSSPPLPSSPFPLSLDSMHSSPSSASSPSASASASSSFPHILFNALDRRLCALEKCVGLPIGVGAAPPSSSSSSPSPSAPLLSSTSPDLYTCLMTIHRKLQLLDANKLETINKSLKSVISEQETLVSMGNNSPNTNNNIMLDKRVTDTYDLLTRWDSYLSHLPLLISRLKSLSYVHSQQSAAIELVNNISKEQDNLRSFLLQDEQLLNNISKSFKENMAQIEENFNNINKQMKGLEQKIELLK